MSKVNRERRNFLKKSSALIAGGSVLALLEPAQSLFAEELNRMGPFQSTDIRNLRKQYLLGPNITYLNHGSIGTIPGPVHQAHANYLKLCESNPWLYMWSEPWEEAREEVRKKLAAFMGVEPADLAITHNTTEGFNLLACGLPMKKGDEVVFSSLNHVGASQCWFQYAKTRGFSVKKFQFPIKRIPSMTKEEFVSIYASHIGPNTRVLVFPHIDNIVGFRYPVKEMAAMARKKGVEFIAVDGAQSVGMLDFQVADLGVDFYATSSHKWVQGPKGAGMLYVRREVQPKLEPMWVTFGQNIWKGTVRIFEDYGTRNLAAVMALGDAVAFQQKLDLKATEKRRFKLWQYLYERVKENDKLIWRSPVKADQATAIVAVEVKGKKSTDIFKELYPKNGIVFRPFYSKEWNALRISPNITNTENEINTLIKLLIS